MAIIPKPAGVPIQIWKRYEQAVLNPYIQKNAARLSRGVTQQDIDYLTGNLSNMLERSGISGLGADEVYGPPSPTPEKKGIDWGGMVSDLFKAVPKVAESIVGYKLGKEAIKVSSAERAAASPVKPLALPTFFQTEEGFPWMTVAIVGVVALGGYFLAKKFKFI